MSPLNRQVIAALSLAGLLIAVYMLLYKLGAIPTVACVGGGCATVQSSRWALFLGVPVAGWGVAGYLAILGVALAGIQPRFADARWVSLALVALTGVALLFSMYLSALEEWVIGAWCQWCIASAIIATLSFVAAVPEWRRLRG